jgi:hypothetical protein
MFGKTTVSISKKDQPYTSKLRGVAALLGEVAPEAATQKAVAVTAIHLPPAAQALLRPGQVRAIGTFY